MDSAWSAKSQHDLYRPRGWHLSCLRVEPNLTNLGGDHFFTVEPHQMLTRPAVMQNLSYLFLSVDIVLWHVTCLIADCPNLLRFDFGLLTYNDCCLNYC